MEHEKFSYVEALKWLASRYNVEVEEAELSPEIKIQQQTADSLYILNAFAQKFFSNCLQNDEEGQNIGLSYLQERGFNAAIIEKFQLGYNPSAPDAFSQAAIDRSVQQGTSSKKRTRCDPRRETDGQLPGENHFSYS